MLPDQNLEPPTREHIERLVKEELRLLAQQTLADSDQLRIEEIHAALDRCCDVLHERRTERERRQRSRRPAVHVGVNDARRIPSLPAILVTREADSSPEL